MLKTSKCQMTGRINDDKNEVLTFVPREPEHTKEGAVVLKNHPFDGAWPDATWEPHRTMAEYINERDGWLLDEHGNHTITGQGIHVWDPRKVDGTDLIQILLKHHRTVDNWADGIMFEMFARVIPIPGWGDGSDELKHAWARFFDDAMVIIARRTGPAMNHSCNGFHDTYVPKWAKKHFAWLKLEGFLFGEDDDFPSYTCSRGTLHGKPLTINHWIDRMQLRWHKWQGTILEGFRQKEWSSEKRERYDRLGAGICALFDGTWLRHELERGPDMWRHGSSYNVYWDHIKGLGDGIDEPVRNAEVWHRRFENGLLMVNTSNYQVRAGSGDVLGAYGVKIKW